MGSREQGGVAEVRENGGSERTYTFEELFPARAKLIEEYYDL